MPVEIARLVTMIDADPRPLKEIASAGGISVDHLYQVRSGSRMNPSIETVAKILRALGKDWGDLAAKGD
jgi:DNA-binding phage protein